MGLTEAPDFLYMVYIIDQEFPYSNSFSKPLQMSQSLGYLGSRLATL
jgi:hypothetical protein